MKIAYVTNVINAHQSFLADELNKLADEYTYIELQEPCEELNYKVPSSFNIYEKPYLLQAWKSEENRQKAIDICKNVDMLMSGGFAGVIPYESERLKLGKLTFETSERQLKRGLFNAFSSMSRKLYYMYHFSGHKNLYKLCASAFTANDMYLLHPFFKGKCYKWGYFTYVPSINIDKVINKRKCNKHIKIFYNARLINWKHPEFPIYLAKELKTLGYKFEINMVGEGILIDRIISLINKYDLNDIIHLIGQVSNEDVYNMMYEHDIFIFTSNKREGWGAVLNEAMSCGCACIASDLIGATPYLIKDGENGFKFKTGNIKDLIKKVRYLIDHSDFREKMQLAAYKTMADTWNPRIAARNLYHLTESILMDEPISIDEGPCSIAHPIKGKTLTW